MGDTREAVAGDIVELVATQVEEACGGREPPRNFGVTAVLTRGVVCLSLKTGRKRTEGTKTQIRLFCTFEWYINTHSALPTELSIIFSSI